MTISPRFAPTPSAAQLAGAAELDPVLRSGCYAAIGLFAIAVLAVLQIASDIMTPIISAVVVGTILARISDRFVKWGMAPLAAGFCVFGFAATAGVLMVNALIEPFSAMVAQAPHMAEALSKILATLLEPLANLRKALTHVPAAAPAAGGLGGETDWLASFLASFLGRLTPALGQLMVFFASLAFFVTGRSALRRQLILAMPERASRLTAIRAIAAVEESLSVYFGATTAIYAAVGALTALVAWLGGLSNPLLWGAMTFVAGYIPYFGAALIALALAASGFLVHPQSLIALAPAAAYLVIHIASETFVIPTLLGRRHEINPFLIFLSIVFWSWMWGPVGAILASPLLLTVQTLTRLLTGREAYLP